MSTATETKLPTLEEAARAAVETFFEVNHDLEDYPADAGSVLERMRTLRDVLDNPEYRVVLKYDDQPDLSWLEQDENPDDYETYGVIVERKLGGGEWDHHDSLWGVSFKWETGMCVPDPSDGPFDLDDVRGWLESDEGLADHYIGTIVAEMLPEGVL